MPFEIRSRIFEFLIPTSPQAHQTLFQEIRSREIQTRRPPRLSADVLDRDYGIEVAEYRPLPILQVCRRIRREGQDLLNKHTPTIVHAATFRGSLRTFLCGGNINVRDAQELHVVLGTVNTGLVRLARKIKSNLIMARRLCVHRQDISIHCPQRGITFAEFWATL